MMSLRRRLLRVALPSPLLALLGCGDATSPEPDVIIPQTTQVIPASTFAAQLESISPDSATFVMKRGSAQVDGLRSGDVLVTEAGLGYLRRILSTSDSAGYLILRTTQGTLTEAIEKGRVSYAGTVSPQAAGARVLYRAPGLNATAGTVGWYLQLHDVVLYDLDGDPGTEWDRIVANGIVELTPYFTFGFDIDDGELQSFTMSVTLTVRDTLELSSGVSLELFDKAIDLILFQGTPIVLLVGSVPVVITPVFSLNLGATGELFAAVKTSVNLESSVTGGVSFAGGEWAPIADAEHHFGFEPPDLSAGLELKGYLGPRLSFMLYGVAGPYVKGSYYLLLSADITQTPWAVLYGGIELGAGVLVRVLSHVLAEYEDPDVIGVRVKLWESPAAPLAAPSDLAATPVSTSQIDLTWQDNADGEEGFRIERCTGAGCTVFTEIAELGPNVTSYQNTGLAEATSYSYRVRAYAGADRSAYSNVATAMTQFAVPTAPSNLVATPVSTSQIDLTWQDNADNEDGFTIERCAGAECAGFIEVAAVGPNVTSYQDTGVLEGTSYSYRVRAYRGAARSAYSNIATAMTQAGLPAAPSNLAATPVSASQIDLAWQDNADNEEGFRIERCARGACSDFTEIAQVGANVTSYQDTGLEGATSYSYRVRAFNAAGNSGYSNTATAATGPAGRIAFTSSRDGNYEIYVMDPDGSGLTRLTNDAADDRAPAWSPDGTKIAFSRTRDGDTQIYVMNADGSGVTQLTTNADGQNGEPTWSPDGMKIAFTSTRDGNPEIYVMNADGSGATRLTNNTPNEDLAPAWSPDGTQIAFYSGHYGNFDYAIYVMNADGSSVTRLAELSILPSWSPDGTKIVFESTRDWVLGQNQEIYVMNANGSGATRLTNNTVIDTWPTWSADGTRIAFTSNRDGNYEIYVMSAGGSGVTRLTTAPGLDFEPAWSTQ